DIAQRDAADSVERLQPTGFAQTIVGGPAGLDMDGGDDILPRRVAAIVGRQVVALQRFEIAEPAKFAGAGGEPGMALKAEIPEMMMGVDDRAVVDSGQEMRSSRRAVTSA